MRYFVVLLCFLVQFSSFGQCGSTLQDIEMKDRESPGYKKGVETAIEIAKKYEQRNLLSGNFERGNGDTIIIPVVVHIVYKTPEQNVSIDRVTEQLEVLNRDFARLNADTNKTPSSFKSKASGLPIKFCLAVRDPDGNATTGVLRIATTRTEFDRDNGFGESMKYTAQGGSDAWPRDDYFNIWVCNLDDDIGNTGSGNILLGFAQFPGGIAATDGVAIDYKVFGKPNPAPFPTSSSGRTTTHEVGHWLGLFHIWGDDGTACSGSDQIDDTPNQAGNNSGACRVHPYNDGCSSAVMFMNYMDYSTDACMNMFSVGQCARMTSVLNTTRKPLKSSLGCLTTNLPTRDAVLLEIIEPTERSCSNASASIVIQNLGLDEITSLTLQITIGGTIVRNEDWSGSIPSLSKKTIALPVTDISSLSDGVHTYQVEVINVNGADDANTENNLYTINIDLDNSSEAIPYAESFEAPIEGIIKIINPDLDKTWERTNKARKLPGTYSMYMNYFNYPNNEQQDEFLLPAVDLRNSGHPFLYFDVAYALQSATGFSDTLEVYVQDECEGTWNLLYKKFDNNLTTAPLTTAEFRPTQAQWRRDSIDLSAFQKERVTIKYVGKCDYENNLYIDNINIKSNTVTGLNLNYLDEDNFNVYPNPAHNQLKVFYQSNYTSKAYFEVLDATGKIIQVGTMNVDKGDNIVKLDLNGWAKGVYVLTWRDSNSFGTRRFVVE